MSAIDYFINVHVGTFCNRFPIYWLNETGVANDLTDNVLDDWAIGVNTLSVGGGSGEHPALLIDCDVAVLEVFSLVKERDDWSGISDYLSDMLFERVDRRYLIDLNHWPISSWVEVSNAICLDNPKLGQKYDSYILFILGMFVIHELPDVCIADARVREFARIMRERHYEIEYEAEVPNWCDFVSSPLRCGTYGKNIVNGQCVWGYSLNDWYRNNGG